jgi:hypothetical protein
MIGTNRWLKLSQPVTEWWRVFFRASLFPVLFALERAYRQLRFKPGSAHPVQMRITKSAGFGRAQTTDHLALFPSRHSRELQRSPGFEAFNHMIEQLLRLNLIVIVLGPFVDDLV